VLTWQVLELGVEDRHVQHQPPIEEAGFDAAFVVGRHLRPVGKVEGVDPDLIADEPPHSLPRSVDPSEDSLDVDVMPEVLFDAGFRQQ